jgi:hypothetical protein
VNGPDVGANGVVDPNVGGPNELADVDVDDADGLADGVNTPVFLNLNGAVPPIPAAVELAARAADAAAALATGRGTDAPLLGTIIALYVVGPFFSSCVPFI